jgi:hypothetical protein
MENRMERLQAQSPLQNRKAQTTPATPPVPATKEYTRLEKVMHKVFLLHVI